MIEWAYRDIAGNNASDWKVSASALILREWHLETHNFRIDGQVFNCNSNKAEFKAVLEKEQLWERIKQQRNP